MVAGDRRRPAASNAAETVMGSPPNCTADRARCFIAAPRLVARVRLRSAYALRKPATRQTGASTSSAAGASHARTALFALDSQARVSYGEKSVSEPVP